MFGCRLTLFLSSFLKRVVAVKILADLTFKRIEHSLEIWNILRKNYHKKPLNIIWLYLLNNFKQNQRVLIISFDNTLWIFKSFGVLSCWNNIEQLFLLNHFCTVFFLLVSKILSSSSWIIHCICICLKCLTFNFLWQLFEWVELCILDLIIEK